MNIVPLGATETAHRPSVLIEHTRTDQQAMPANSDSITLSCNAPPKSIPAIHALKNRRRFNLIAFLKICLLTTYPAVGVYRRNTIASFALREIAYAHCREISRDNVMTQLRPRVFVETKNADALQRGFSHLEQSPTFVTLLESIRTNKRGKSIRVYRVAPNESLPGGVQTHCYDTSAFSSGDLAGNAFALVDFERKFAMPIEYNSFKPGILSPIDIMTHELIHADWLVDNIAGIRFLAALRHSKKGDFEEIRVEKFMTKIHRDLTGITRMRSSHGGRPCAAVDVLDDTMKNCESPYQEWQTIYEQPDTLAPVDPTYLSEAIKMVSWLEPEVEEEMQAIADRHDALAAGAVSSNNDKPTPAVVRHMEHALAFAESLRSYAD